MNSALSSTNPHLIKVVSFEEEMLKVMKNCRKVLIDVKKDALLQSHMVLKDVQYVKQLFYFIYKIKTKKDFKAKILGNKLNI
jgi:hypothetical protein